MQSGQAHVDQLGLPFSRDQNIRRLNVAMDDFFFPSMRERVGNLTGKTQSVADWDWSVIDYQIAQVYAVDILKDNIRQTPITTDEVNARDVWMIEPGRRPVPRSGIDVASPRCSPTAKPLP